MEEEKELNQTETKKKLNFTDQFKQDQKALAEAEKAFNIDDFIVDADKTFTVYVPEINRTIKYKRLNNEDGGKLEPFIKASKYEQGIHTLALMMFKADGKTTFEKLQKMSTEDAAAILNAINSGKKLLASTP